MSCAETRNMHTTSAWWQSGLNHRFKMSNINFLSKTLSKHWDLFLGEIPIHSRSHKIREIHAPLVTWRQKKNFILKWLWTCLYNEWIIAPNGRLHANCITYTTKTKIINWKREVKYLCVIFFQKKLNNKFLCMQEKKNLYKKKTVIILSFVSKTKKMFKTKIK